MTENRSVLISSPAKINLGLEIIGKRQDGFHEIRTAMAMIDITDDIQITLDPDSDEVTIEGFKQVPKEDNLILKAVRIFEKTTGIRSGYQIEVVKRIPYPGGLAGASSNAASTLIALNATHGAPVPADHLVRLSEQLGSDVPFFMGATVALARGTGTELEALPPLDGWVLVLVPAVPIEDKTRTLYGMLTPDDFTRDNHIAEIVATIRDGRFPAPNLLTNAFLRPLSEIAPEVPQTMDLMRRCGCPFVALTGAGPGLYTHFDDEQAARQVLEELQDHIATDDFCEVVPFTLAAHNASLLTA